MIQSASCSFLWIVEVLKNENKQQMYFSQIVYYYLVVCLSKGKNISYKNESYIQAYFFRFLLERGF